MTLEQAVSTIDDDIRGGFVAFASKSEAWAVIRAAVPLVVQPDTATNSAMVPCGLPKRVACQYRDNNALAARHTQTKMVTLIEENRQLRDALAAARQSITDLELAVSQANHSIAELRGCVAKQAATLGEHGKPT